MLASVMKLHTSILDSCWMEWFVKALDPLLTTNATSRITFIIKEFAIEI